MKNYEEKTISSEINYTKGKLFHFALKKLSFQMVIKQNVNLLNIPVQLQSFQLLQKGKLVLVKQYRKALNRTLIEIPAGRIEIDEAPK